MRSESRFEMKLPAQLKEQAQNRAGELGISLAEYVKSLLKKDVLRNSDREMTFEEAIEIYLEHFDDGYGQVIQPGVDSSYLKGGIWYLRNIKGHIARVGTKCRCVLPDTFRRSFDLRINELKESAFRVCTMPNEDWFVSDIFSDIEELAHQAGGDIVGYDLGEMAELFGVTIGEDDDDPYDAVLKAT